MSDAVDSGEAAPHPPPGRQDRPRRRDLPGVLYESLSSAFDKFDDFLEVQGQTISLEAVLLLQEAAGVNERERRVVAERVVTLQSTDKPFRTGGVLLGILLGLFAAQFESK